mmetsp:Transcript_2280/g.4802  ORF Transcript_2280/g.4802 Transcript_2280/m.4802 type:complete len:102 (+) Transcript_2280:401-706(+)
MADARRESKGNERRKGGHEREGEREREDKREDQHRRKLDEAKVNPIISKKTVGECMHARAREAVRLSTQREETQTHRDKDAMRRGERREMQGTNLLIMTTD